jgi:dUTP pyrophosphatase
VKPAGLKVLIKRLDPELPIPKYAKAGDAGVDIFARVDAILLPGERKLIPTGIAIAMPRGYVALAHPRSGLAIKSGISMVNTPGTIDAAYRGELAVILINHDQLTPFQIRRGDRIAQLVFQKVEEAEFIEVENLPGSERAAGGFGSTGMAAARNTGESKI